MAITCLNSPRFITFSWFNHFLWVQQRGAALPILGATTKTTHQHSGVRAHHLARPQRLATRLDTYALWVTFSVHDGWDSRPQPRRVLSSTQPLTDKWLANSLACNGDGGKRRHCRRSRCRSGGASRLQGARNATSRLRSAQRTVPSPPLFGRNDASWCRYGMSNVCSMVGHSRAQQPPLSPFAPPPRTHPCVLEAAAWSQGGSLYTDCIAKFMAYCRFQPYRIRSFF